MPRIIQTNPDGSPIGSFLNQSRRFRNLNPVQPNSIVQLSSDKFFVYSGVVQGDVSVPASISLINIDDIGTRDCMIKILPFYGQPNSGAGNTALGIEIKINDVSIYNSQRVDPDNSREWPSEFFIPRQSRLEIISLNTSGNNTQNRGVNVTGEYI